MQSSRNFTLQRYGGGNGNRMGDHGYTATMFRDLDIAATVMYKDGGYGDRPIYAPILADVLRTRTKNTRRGPPQTARSVHRPLDVWTQVHTHSGPALFQRHVMRQVFFALSQKVEGITYFECQTRPQEPTYIDHADTLRDCTARFCEPYGDLLRACDKGYKRVAIYYSRKADHLGLHKAAKAPFQCEGLWAACMRAGFPADFLYDEQILAGEGHDYDVIFTPNFTIADEVPGNILKSLRSLADDGKLLVAERGSKLPIEGLRRLDSDFGEFDDGMRNAWPKYIDSTFDEVFELSEKTTALVGDFLKQHIPPAAEHGMVLGPDWLRSRSGKYLVVSNFAPTNFTGLHKTLYQAPDTPTLSFPKAGEVCYDMLEMKRMKVIASRRGVKAPPGSEATTLWQTLEADLRHYPGKIYAFLPAAIDRVHLEAPPTVSTGADLNYRVAVRDAQGKPIDAGFPLEVQLRTPRGDLIYEVFRAATPQYRGAYTIPVNTEPGIWRLRVRELISGAWSEATINVTAGDLPLAKLDEREVWLRDETRIAEFLGRSTKSDDKEINIVVDDRQMPHIAPLAERLRSGLKRHGIRAKIVNYNDVFVIPIGEMLAGGMANVDGRRDWRGGLIAPSIFVEAPVILIGKRYENSLIEAIITADVLAEPLTDNFPGAGRGLVGWARRAFSNYFDTVCVLASDDGGLHRGIDALLEIAASEGRFANPSRDAVHPNIQLGTPDADAKLAPANKTDRTPSSYREAISNEDLVVSLDVDPATGRTLVGTFGYGQNLFCFSADGELLWKTFLPEHNVYFARWYDGGKKVVAATGRGYYAFLIEAATGRVFKKFSATEWPTFHGGEGAVTTKVGFNFNPKLRQILVRGRTGLLAVTYEGERMWFHDRLPVIAEYCQEAEQTAAASFIQNCRIKNVAISPDGGRLAYSEIRVIGSAIGFGGYYTVWGHRPQVIDARSGEVLASFFDDRGSSGNPDVRVSWPADSNLPFAHIGPFQAVMQLDGKIGEYKLDSGLGRKNSPVTVLDEKPPSGLQLLPNYTRMLSADGETVWENYAAEPWLVPEKSLSWGVGDDRLQSYPSSADGKRIYRVNPFGEIRAISLADGRTLWEANVRFSAKLFPIDGELIAATNNGMIVRLDAAGKLRWKKRLRDLYSKPVGDYRSYILAANLRDAEAAIRVFDTGTDRPGEYDGVLRMGIEQLADGGFENTKSVPRLEGERPDDSPPGAGVGVWYTAGGSVEIVAVGRSGNRGLQLGASQSAGQQVARKVIPSATYLLEFWFKTDSPGVNLAAGCELVSGGGPGVTASVFRGRPGQWAFGRLAVKSMSDTQAISVLFEAEGGVVLVDDVSLRAVRFPSANLLADPELHEVEPTFVDDVRVKYDKLPTGLREKLMEQNHVAAYRQGGTSSRTIYLQEQAFLHNGRQDDLGRRWIGLADPIGFSAVLQEPAWISHVVLYLNNATPDNAYEFIGILANDFALQPPVPKTVGIVRGNRRQFIVVHLPEPVFTDSIKILPGKHPALSDCLTEVELYGPLGGPDVGGRGFPNDADGVPMFMGGPAHVRKNLPPDMVGNYRQVFLQHHNAAFHSSGTIFHDRYNIGDPSGLVRDGEGRVSNWGGLKPLVRNDSGQFRWDKTRLLQTVGLTSTPAHYSGRMLVGAADHKLHAVADNGAYLWGFKTGGRVYSSPVPNGDDVYFGSDDGRLYKVDIDSGILIWEFATGGKIRSAPVLSFADNLAARVFFASYDGHVYSVDARSGSLVWKAPIGPFSRTSPALANGRIYIGDEQGTAHALDAANGRGVWSVKLDGYISRCPVVTADGVTFVTDQGTAALVGHDGRVRWQRNLGSRLSGQSAATQTQIIVPTESALHVLRRQDGLADGRFVPPSPLGNLVDITVYKDRLYFVQRRVNIVEYGNRTFAEFRSQVGVWQAPEIATKK
ncbi:MAG: PQQ-binding-like beta-propeller repeat protein [Planctomycetota bacterium]|nr:PQQ-binding-like beta-propeller repeat protein [Planctomycetota bacterium]